MHVQLFLSACFSLFCEESWYISASNLNFSGRRHVVLLFSNEKQKKYNKIKSWLVTCLVLFARRCKTMFMTSLIHTAGHKKGSIQGDVLRLLKCGFLANTTMNRVKNCCVHNLLSFLIPVLSIGSWCLFGSVPL